MIMKKDSYSGICMTLLERPKKSKYPIKQSPTEKVQAEIRKEANSLTAEYRAELFKKGMAIINGTKHPSKPTKKRKE